MTLSGSWSFKRRRIERQLSQQLPQFVQLLLTCLSAGQSLSSAMRAAAEQLGAPFQDLVSRTLAQLQAGMSWDEALAHWLMANRSEEMRLLVTTLTFAVMSGGRLRDSLQRLERLAIGRQQLQQKVAAITAQGRLQGWVMASLPFLILAMIRLVDSDYLTPLTATTLGKSLLVATGILNLGGLLWIRHLTRCNL